MIREAVILASFAAPADAACRLALALGIDVSRSVGLVNSAISLM